MRPDYGEHGPVCKKRLGEANKTQAEFHFGNRRNPVISIPAPIFARDLPPPHARAAIDGQCDASDEIGFV